MAAVRAVFLEAAAGRHVVSMLLHQLDSKAKLRQSLVLLLRQVSHVDLFYPKGKSMTLPLTSSKVIEDTIQMKMY